MSNCVICGNHVFKSHFKNLQKCQICDLVFYRLDKINNTNNLYKKDYFNGKEYFNYKNDKKIIQLNFRKRLKEINRYKKNGSLLEIGCAYGFFLELAKRNFNVTGIDIAPEATEFARKKLKLQVETKSYLDKKIIKKVDVISMWDTIEHLEFPEKFINKINFDLKTGGYLFLTTGDIDSLIAKLQGPEWRMIHPPTHLFYFSKTTITRLLKKHGFEVLSITYPGVFRNLKQILYSLLVLNKHHKINFISTIINKINLPIYLNTYDIMSVVAKKIQ